MIYRLDYCNAQGDELRLDIQYGSPTVVNIEGTGNPFTLNYKGDKDDKSLNFLTSSADISLFETEDFNIDMLKTSSEIAISVKYYVNSNLFWQGYVIPDFFSKEITDTPIINMVASDRLGTLKSVSLSSDTLPSMITFRELTIKCLQKTGLSLPLKTVANFNNGTGSATDGFFMSKVLTQRLADTKGRNISCYDILDSILTASGSKLMQRGGEWVIINKDQHERGEGTVFNTPITNITPTNNHAWSEVIHNFSDIAVGGRRTIIPVASSVGVYQEYGGGLSYPENYDFSNGLTGWTKVNGFVGEVKNNRVENFQETGVAPEWTISPIYGDSSNQNYLVNTNYGIDHEFADKPYIRSSNVPIVYPNLNEVEVSVNINATAPHTSTSVPRGQVNFAVIATKGSTNLFLNSGGTFQNLSGDPYLHKMTFIGDEQYNAVSSSKMVKGLLQVEEGDLSGYNITVRIYGHSQGVTGGRFIVSSLINSVEVKVTTLSDVPKGTIYKVEQGDNFTKVHDLSTSIFGDYLTSGVNGYFYNYPIDDTSSIYNASNELTSLWTTPTAPHDTSQQPLLLHIARQRARMFSIAHDLLDISLDINDFDPLKIFVDCFGRRYVVVASEYDLLRSMARVTVEQIAFNGTIFKQDFIYSYFGEGEKGISSVGGISGGSGGGGGTPSPQYWYLDENGNLRTDYNAYSTKELSAYGYGGSGGGGGGGDGLIQNVYAYSNLGGSFSNTTLTDTFNAYTINRLHERLLSVEGSGGGSVVTWGATSNSFSSLLVEGVTKTVALQGHNHAISDVTGLQAEINKIPTATKQEQWDVAYAQRHTHSNKTQIDLITQAHINVLDKLFLDSNGNVYTTENFYSEKEVSAYGYGGSGGGGGGGGGGGIIETVYGYSNLGQTFNNTTLTDTFNAYTINQINNRLLNVEAGGVGVPTSRTITAGAGLTGGGDLSANRTLALDTAYTDNRYYGYIDSAIEGIEIGGRNLIIGRFNDWRSITVGQYGYTSVYIPIQDDWRGKTVTHSLEVKDIPEGESIRIRIDIHRPDNTYTILSFGNIVSLAGKSFATYIVPTDTQYDRIRARIIPVDYTSDYNVLFRGEKLEFGNKPTDWTPAPEDVQAEIDSKLSLTGGTLTGSLTAPSFIGSLSGNASTATKLATPRTIWGQSFDGSGIVSGALSGATTGNFSGTVTAPTFNQSSALGGVVHQISATSGNLSQVWALTNTSQLTSETTANSSFYGIAARYVSPNRWYEWYGAGILTARIGLHQGDAYFKGNVGIGTISPSYKLDVSGTGRFTGPLTASTSVTTPKVIFNATGWSMEQVGTELQMKHNGNIRMRFLSDGSIVAIEEITAFA